MNPDPSSKKIHLEIRINATNPLLLEGLETWLKLGLINEAQVRKVSQQYLSCSLPTVKSVSAVDSLQVVESENVNTVTSSNIRTNPIQTFFSQFVTSFREELSLRWLLFLGLFLVIVSSGVLAATQWQNFSPVGQYLILWSYTLVFWLIGFWSKRQENLQLTSQTLQAITLFLIPLNFWAMATFQLWQQSLDVAIIIAATLSLLGIYYYSRQTNYNLIGQVNYIGLNLLHWAWINTIFSISAIYLSTVLTALYLTFFKKQFRTDENTKNNFSKFLLIYGLSILLIRGIFFVKLPLASLSLAIGFCGWLLRKQTEEDTLLDKVLDVVGLILLILGWCVAIYHDATWQALGITTLGLHYFWEKLCTNWKLINLFALFIIGFQSLFLIEDVIPLAIRKNINNIWLQFSQTPDYSLSIYSLIYFPYILLWVWFTGWLYSQEKPKLASFGEWLTLGLGICLTSLSLETIAGRSLNLLLSTSTLVYLISSRSLRVSLIYFTHALGLLTIISWIDWRFPSLSLNQWGYFLVLLTAGEWLNSLRYKSTLPRNKKQWWFLSSWHFGFILATFSFFVFLFSLNQYFVTEIKQYSILSWLFVPSFLTIIAIVTKKKRSRQAALLSSFAFVFAQFLMLWQPSIRLISLGYSALVMLINSFYYKRPLTARLPILMICVLGTSWIFEKWFIEGDIITAFFLREWVLFNGIYITSLWLFRNWLKQRQNRIASIYTLALDQVASVLCIFELVRLTLHTFLLTFNEFNTSWHWLVTAILIAFSLVYRYWKEPLEITVYGWLLSIEFVVIESVYLLNGSKLVISAINLFLAFASFYLTRLLFAQSPRFRQLKSLQISPLLFAGIVILWRLGELTSYTGLLTLGVAIVGLCVSSRFPQNKALIYLSLFSITVAFHEIIIYKLWQNVNYSLANELISLTLLQIGLACIYRLLVWQSRKREFEAIRHIPVKILETIADLNWVISIIFKIIALISAVFLVTQSYPNVILYFLTLTIGIYALFKARHSTLKNRWVYLGFVDLYLTVIFARWIWQQLEILDPYFGIISVIIALIIYHLPWAGWGWHLKPWRNIACSVSLITAVLTFSEISDFSLFSIAGFYIYLAFHQKTIRWSYLTVIILNWLDFRFLDRQNLTDILYYTSAIGLSVLYLAQVEPKLQESHNRKIRHYLRILGSSIINVPALVFHQETGLTPGIISLLTVLVGLGLKIKAFLLVGTLTFMLTVFYQLVVLSFQYTLLKWIIGLVVGILLITVAANFERRRVQMLNLFQNSLEQFNRWD